MNKKFEAKLMESYISIEQFSHKYLEKENELNKLI